MTGAAAARTRAAARAGLALALAVALLGGVWHLARDCYVVRWPTTERVVVLTFDDGPDATWTPEVLDTLASRRVPAMFFVPGNRAGGIKAAGYLRHDPRHVVAAHGYSHHRLPDAGGVLAADLRRGRAVLERELPADARTPYVRPPRGIAGPVALLDLLAHGEVVVGWSAAYDRSEFYRIPDRAARIRVFADSIGPGDVILMHDGNGHAAQMAGDLPGIIDALRERGYRFATLEELRR